MFLRSARGSEIIRWQNIHDLPNMLRRQIQRKVLLDRGRSFWLSESAGSRGERPACMSLVLDQGFVAGRALSLVFVVLAVSIDPARKEELGLRAAWESEHAVLCILFWGLLV